MTRTDSTVAMAEMMAPVEEDHGDDQDDRLASVFVGEAPGHRGANRRTGQGGAGERAEHQRVELELVLEERQGAGDHSGVVAEQQAAERRDERYHGVGHVRSPCFPETSGSPRRPIFLDDAANLIRSVPTHSEAVRLQGEFARPLPVEGERRGGCGLPRRFRCRGCDPDGGAAQDRTSGFCLILLTQRYNDGPQSTQRARLSILVAFSVCSVALTPSLC